MALTNIVLTQCKLILQLSHGLERCVAKANQLLMRHNIILGVDDRGKLSCQKTHLCFIYFDTSDCVVGDITLISITILFNISTWLIQFSEIIFYLKYLWIFWEVCCSKNNNDEKYIDYYNLWLLIVNNILE